MFKKLRQNFYSGSKKHDLGVPALTSNKIDILLLIRRMWNPGFLRETLICYTLLFFLCSNNYGQPQTVHQLTKWDGMQTRLSLPKSDMYKKTEMEGVPYCVFNNKIWSQ